MPKKINKYSHNQYLKVSSATIILLVVTTIVLVFTIMSSIPHYNPNLLAQNGQFDTTEESSKENKLFYLRGDWTYYKNVFLSPENFDESLLINGEIKQLPYSKVTEASGTATYKLDLKFKNKKSLFLYIPYLKHRINVFLNGKLLHAINPADVFSSKAGIGLGLFRISNYDENLESQQLIISTNQDPTETAFFKRYIILSSFEGINSLIFTTSVSQFMFFAILLVITFNGFLFMFLNPSHRVMSDITLFDFFVTAMIIMNFPAILGFFTSISPHFALQDSTIVTINVLLLAIIGIQGIVFSRSLFDPQYKVNKKIWYDCNILVFIILSVLFVWDIGIYDQYGLVLFTLAGLMVFVSIAKRTLIYYREYGCTNAFLFHTIKSAFVTIVLLLVMLKQNFVVYNNLAIYNFCLAFITLHLIARIHDSYLNYKKVKILNIELEATVAERTKNLQEANEALQKSNKILNEIAIRDALTKIYNRLYFEEKIKSSIAEFETNINSLYLCIFDLDFFKKINDTYGHKQGDKSLIKAVDIASEILPTDCVFARIGGEEFAIIFIDKNDAEVLSILEKIRVTFEIENKQSIHFTTSSFGVSKYKKDMGTKKWFVNADNALYRAKAKGRNNVESDFDLTDVI